jgi:hypothetical protein
MYTVLDDNYVSKLRNTQDTFLFYGYVSYYYSPVVVETYVIEADECHVQKISGKESVVI